MPQALGCIAAVPPGARAPEREALLRARLRGVLAVATAVHAAGAYEASSARRAAFAALVRRRREGAVRRAVGEGEFGAAAAVVRRHADLADARLTNGVGLMAAACALGGGAPLVEALLEAPGGRGGGVNDPVDARGLGGAAGATPLYLAARGGHADTVALLLSRGAAPNAAVALDPGAGAGGDSATPLMAAAQCGHEGAVAALLGARGVDVNAASARGNRALMHAALRGRGRVIRALLEANARPGEVNARGWTARDVLRAVGGRDAALLEALAPPPPGAVAGAAPVPQVDDAGALTVPPSREDVLAYFPDVRTVHELPRPYNTTGPRLIPGVVPVAYAADGRVTEEDRERIARRATRHAPVLTEGARNLPHCMVCARGGGGGGGGGDVTCAAPRTATSTSRGCTASSATSSSASPARCAAGSL